MKRFVLPSLLAAVAASQLGATDCGEIISDRGFDLWCGDQLCAWDLDHGAIERVPTWHRGDDGVALLGPDTAIAQDTEVNDLDGTCIRFTTIAHVDESAQVSLGIDIGGDGTVDHTERVPTSDWARVTFLLRLAPPFDGVRFVLTRTGSGEAVLASIGAEIAEGCTGAPIARATVDGDGVRP
jgi:hypothetical protein